MGSGDLPSASREKWDARWTQALSSQDPPSTSTFQVAAPWLPLHGRAIDVAGGLSADSLALAAAGFITTVADISPVALQAVKQRGLAAGLDVSTLQIDLEHRPLPAGPWEVISIGNYLDRHLLSSLSAALTPAGIVVIVVATTTNLERHDHPSRRFLVKPDQLPDLARGLDVLHHSEAWRINGRHEAHLVASPGPPAALAAAKERWRRWAVERRSTEPIATHSTAVCGHLAGLVTPNPRHRVVVFSAMDDEISLVEAAAAWPARSTATTRTPDSGPLTLHPSEVDLEAHRYGFSQPVADAPRLPIAEVSAVAVPGLAFDRFGGRLGRGRGYYDQLLAQLPPDTPRIGITVDALVVDRLPMDAHDVPMTHLITETGVIEVV